MVSLEEAAKVLRPELQEQVNFFADEDKRNFVDPITLTVIGTSLITLFLNAMVGEFGKTVGHEVGMSAVSVIKKVMHGDTPNAAEQEAAVEAARKTLATLPPDQFDELVGSVRAGMSKQLADVLTDDGAAALATNARDLLLGVAPR